MVILFIVIAMSAMGFGLILPSFLFVANNMGASAAVATGIVAVYSIAQFFATPVWGRLSDRFGRKPVLAISILGASLSYFLMAYAETIVALALARGFGGLMAGNFSAATAYVSDITTPENRARGMGVVGAGMSLGFIAGPAIGGFLAGESAETASLYWPGLVAGVVALLTFLSIVLFLKESLTPENRAALVAQRVGGKQDGIATVLKRPIIFQMLITAVMVVFAMGIFETIYPLWSEARFGFGPRQVGITFIFLGLVIGFVQGWLIGPLSKRFGEQRLATASATIYMVGLTIMALSPNLAVMIVGIGCTAVGSALFNTSMTSLVSMEAGAHERGFVLGLYQAGGWLGRAFGPVAAGLLFLVGVNVPLLVAAVTLIPVLVMIASFRRRIARRQAVAVTT